MFYYSTQWAKLTWEIAPTYAFSKHHAERRLRTAHPQPSSRQRLKIVFIDILSKILSVYSSCLKGSPSRRQKVQDGQIVFDQHREEATKGSRRANRIPPAPRRSGMWKQLHAVSTDRSGARERRATAT
eukprot:1822035-Pleurochrysis_carterae.AAC.1